MTHDDAQQILATLESIRFLLGVIAIALGVQFLVWLATNAQKKVKS